MYSSIQELVGCSGVENSTFCHFTSPNAINLITSIEDRLRIYQINSSSGECKLQLIWEEKIFGCIVGMVRIPGKDSNCKGDRIFISCKEAKGICLAWNDLEQRPENVSLHFFEKEIHQSEFLLNDYPAILRLEPASRCICMRVYKDSLSFIPPPPTSSSQVVEDEDGFFHRFANSFVVFLAQIDKRIRNLIDFSFLPGFVEPTLALLFQPEQTSMGRLAIKKDTCQVIVISVDLIQKSFTTLFQMENLPYNCFSLKALPLPSGGMIVTFPDGIIHLDQGYSGFGMCTNNFPSSEEYSSTAFRFKKNASSLGLCLDKALVFPLNGSQILLWLEDSSIWVLNLIQEGKKYISDMQIHAVSSLQDGKTAYPLPSSFDIMDEWAVFGSRFSDSLIVKVSLVPVSASKEHQLEASISMQFDAIDQELFGSTNTEDCKEFTLSATLHCSIPTYGPIRAACIGMNPLVVVVGEQKDSIQITTLCGKGSSTSLCFWERNLKPKVSLSFSFPLYKSIWSFPFPDSSESDRYLMLSTGNSTLIMELIEDEFNELPISDFYLEGETLFASSCLNHRLIVQVYADGFRCLLNDINVKCTYSYANESVFQIKNALIVNDEILLLLLENGSLLSFELTCENEKVKQIHFDFLDGMMNVFCFASFKCLLALYLKNGTLKIIDLQQRREIFSDSEFHNLPQISLNSSSTTTTLEETSSFEHLNVMEMKLVGKQIAQEECLFLILRNNYAHTISYQIRVKSNTLVKLKASFFCTLFSKDSCFSQGSALRNSLVSLRDSSVVSIGPTTSCLWSISSLDFHPRIHQMHPKIICITSHHSKLAPNGFIYISSDGKLNIATLDRQFSLDSDWPVRKIPICKDASFLDFSLSSQKYILATSSEIPLFVPPSDANSAPEPPLNDEFLPSVAKFNIELFSPLGMSFIDTFALENYEIVTGCKSVILNSKQSNTGKKEYIAISTSYQKGEDRQIRGRILLFEIISIVPDPEALHKDSKFKLIFQEEQKGPVTTLNHVNGYLIAAVGTKLLMFAFDEEENDSLVAIAFLDSGLYSSCITSLKNYCLVGDAYKSAMFFVWQEEPPKLILLGQDGHSLTTSCVDFMIHNKQLYLVVADVFGNVHTFAYAPNHPQSSAGAKLVKKSHIHIGSRVVKLCRFALSENSQGLYYFCLDGSIGVIIPYPEKPFKRLLSVFNRLATCVLMPLGLNVHSHRLALGDSSLSQCISSPYVTRSVLDLDLLNVFGRLKLSQQRDIVHFVGASISKIFHDFGHCCFTVKRFFAIGQPNYATHPHLIGNSNEILSGFDKNCFAKRREKLFSILPDHSFAFISGYKLRYSSKNIFYPFRQNSNVIYLSGMLDPNVAILLYKSKSGECRFVVFCEKFDATEALWSGMKTDARGAIEHFGADEAYSLEEIPSVLKSTKVPSSQAFVEIDENSAINHSSLGIEVSKQSIDVFLQWMRVVKENLEIEAIQQASNLAAEAMRKVMQQNWYQRMESEVSSLFQYECSKRGADMLAYTPVVACGRNALILHYIQNKSMMKEGNLVLIDAGTYFNCYNTDVSRTFPVVGKSFSQEQAELYQIVLQVQKSCLSKLSQSISLDELHDFAIHSMTEALNRIGFGVDEEIVSQVLFPHHVGHYLGLDLHDCSLVSRDIQLQENMVITVEPGIYVPIGDSRFPKKYWGIGIRIEDDVAIRKGKEPLVLSANVPKEFDEIFQ